MLSAFLINVCVRERESVCVCLNYFYANIRDVKMC